MSLWVTGLGHLVAGMGLWVAGVGHLEPAMGHLEPAIGLLRACFGPLADWPWPSGSRKVPVRIFINFCLGLEG